MTNDRERIADIAHDFRAPLTAIVGYASLLEQRDGEEFRLEAAAQIQQAVGAVQESFNALLAELRSVLEGMEGEGSSVSASAHVLAVENNDEGGRVR